jgi:hypothetical protein
MSDPTRELLERVVAGVQAIDGHHRMLSSAEWTEAAIAADRLRVIMREARAHLDAEPATRTPNVDRMAQLEKIAGLARPVVERLRGDVDVPEADDVFILGLALLSLDTHPATRLSANVPEQLTPEQAARARWSSWQHARTSLRPDGPDAA